MAVGAVVARILTQYSDKGSKAAQKDIAKLGKQLDAFAKNTVRAFGIAAAAVGAFAIKVGKDAVQAAIADQKSQALLANSLRNTVGATDSAIAAVEDYISKLQLQVGVADDDLRPALSRLAAVTGDVTSAQQLLGLALDVSAFSGTDLGSASQALTRALQGNFKTLQKLVPSIDTTAIKSKDLAAIFAEVEKTTQGAAGVRANTLEYRLKILQIRYGEILETLGYRLIPVIEQFANVIQTKVLPQIQAWIALNSTKLVNALQAVSDGVIKIILAGIQLADWISNNMGLIKFFAATVATMFTIGKIAGFITAIRTLSGAFVALRTSAAGAAVATAFATGGTSVIAATAALAAVGGAAAIYTGLKSAGNKARAQQTGAIGNYAMSTGSVPSTGASSAKNNPQTSSLNALLKSLNAVNDAEEKSAKAKEKLTKRQEKYNKLLKDMGITTTEQQDAITQFAIRSNLLKQAAITGSPLTSIGSPVPMNMATAGFGGDINVYVQGSVISERDLVTTITKAQQKLTTAGSPIGAKYIGGGGGAGDGRFTTQVL